MFKVIYLDKTRSMNSNRILHTVEELSNFIRELMEDKRYVFVRIEEN